MIIAPEPTLPEVTSTPVAFHDLFICPICGAVGITGERGFSKTERPSWFRCESCSYVFGIELHGQSRSAGVLH